MESSPKIALCLFGSTGYKKSITRNEKGFSKLDEYEIEEPIESLVRHVVEPNTPDVFIHSWSKQHKNYLKTESNALCFFILSLFLCIISL